MALNLLINGRILVQAQPDPWVMADDVAEALKAKARRSRETARAPRQDTPAPARNLQRNTILALVGAGRLRPAQGRAGLEAAMVYEAVTSVVAARTTRYGETGCQGLSNADWPPSLKAASCRYAAWAEWAKVQSVNPRFSLVELVQDVAIDGLGLSQVRRRRGIDERTALRWLQKGLWHYAVMAGWVDDLEHAA
jgi:hypothetical protein